MKSVIRFILIMLCILFHPAQDISAGQLKKTVYTNGPGTLNQVISSEEKYEITDLTICGSINGTDWLFIQEMMGFKFIYLGSGHEEGSFKHEQTNGKLESLNLWQANIVAGGDFYSMGWGGWPQEYTKDNTITSGMFNFAFTYIDYKLKEVVLPNSVKTIESKAFCFVHNLKSVTIGMNVEDMKGSQIFYGCSNMETLIFLGNTPPVMFENNVFSSIYRMPQKIYVPSNAADLYDATPLFTNLKTNGSVSIHQLYYLTLNNQFQGELPLESVSPAQMELISYNPNRSAVSSMFPKNYINDYTYWVKDDVPVTINMKPVYDQYGIEKLIKESTDTGIREDVTCNVKCYGNGIYDYELGIVNTNITIDPQLNTVELFGVEDQERTYGSSNELRYYHYPSGYPDEKQYTTDLEGFLLCDADPTSSCGEYSVKVNPDFPFRPLTRLINTEAKLNVKEAELMIIGPTIEREYGQPNPEVKFEYLGFVNGETPAILTHLPVAFIAQTEESPVGEYEIGMGYAEAPNYEIHYTTGLLRITKASQSIDWNQDFSSARVNDSFELTASSTSGLEVMYSSSNPDIAIIKNNVIKFLSEGRVDVTASQGGDSNHNAAKPVTVSFNVLPPMIETLRINQSEITIEKDNSFQLFASWEPENAEMPELLWESENTQIATVDQHGLVAGINCGETCITVYIKDSPEIKASCIVKVGLSSGINDINEDVDIDITAINGYILIDGCKRQPVNIYTPDGTLIYSGNNNKIPLTSGFYIAKVGKVVKKVKL